MSHALLSLSTAFLILDSILRCQGQRHLARLRCSSWTRRLSRQLRRCVGCFSSLNITLHCSSSRRRWTSSCPRTNLYQNDSCHSQHCLVSFWSSIAFYKAQRQCLQALLSPSSRFGGGNRLQRLPFSVSFATNQSNWASGFQSEPSMAPWEKVSEVSPSVVYQRSSWNYLS